MGPFIRGRKGGKAVLVTVEVISKYVRVFILKNAKAKEIVNVLKEKYLPDMGKPETFQTDHGQQFISHTFRNW